MSARPRELKLPKTVQCIFVGGFLGSDKTTALLQIVHSFLKRGVRAGVITNVQSSNLVDTILVSKTIKGVPVAEVVGGCFCCQFERLIEAAEELSNCEVDVLLGEPVGSCTDFIATVVNPLKSFYPNFSAVPFSVLIDPRRVKEYLLGEVESRFPQEVVSRLSYLLHKQLEEADIIVLNKIDLLAPEETERLTRLLGEQFPSKQVLAVSAKEGQGVDEWLKLLIRDFPNGQHVLNNLDYDRYAQVEAILGWLNATLRLTASRAFDADMFIEKLMANLQKTLDMQGADVAHLKLILTAEGKAKQASLTQINEKPAVSRERVGLVREADLILNARVPLEPGELKGLVSKAIKKTKEATNVQVSLLNLQSFSPTYPCPPYRFSVVQASG